MRYTPKIINDVIKKFPPGSRVTGLSRLGAIPITARISDIVGSLDGETIYGRVGNSYTQMIILWMDGIRAIRG